MLGNMSVTFHRALVLAFALGALAPTSVLASEEDRCQKWFDEQWLAADRWPKLDEVGLRFRVEQRYVPPAAEMAALKSSVEGKPDHPDRSRVRRYERAATDNPEASVFTVWRRGPGNWRINEDYIGWMPIPYQDECVTPDRAWGINAQQLTLVSPAKGYPSGHHFDATEPRVLQDLGFLLTGGLHVAKEYKTTPGRVMLKDDRWTVELVGTELTFQAQGTWDPASATGRIEVLLLSKAPNVPKEVGRRYESTGWRVREAFAGLVVADRVTEFRPNGLRDRVFQYVEPVPAPAGGFAALVATPSLDGADPIRGKYTFVGVHDFTEGSPTIVRRVGELWEKAPAQSEPESPEGRLRVIGWSMLGLLGTGLVALRIRRSFKIAS